MVIKDAMEQLLARDIRMPIYKTIPLELNAVTDAVRLLTTHRSKGRIVIDFGLSELTSGICKKETKSCQLTTGAIGFCAAGNRKLDGGLRNHEPGGMCIR
jgi:hypothetical protein